MTGHVHSVGCNFDCPDRRMDAPPQDRAPAEHAATLVARSPGRVVSMTCTCGVSIVGDVMPFAGVTRLMLEHLNGEQGLAWV